MLKKQGTGEKVNEDLIAKLKNAIRKNAVSTRANKTKRNNNTSLFDIGNVKSVEEHKDWKASKSTLPILKNAIFQSYEYSIISYLQYKKTKNNITSRMVTKAADCLFFCKAGHLSLVENRKVIGGTGL